MFLHEHPYPPFNLEQAQKLIVGTLPPPRFTTGELKKGDVDFCYGSIDGQLWNILDQIFNLNLKFEDSLHAINERKKFLEQKGIGICDIVASAKRNKVDASDLGMQDVKLRDLIGLLKKHRQIDTLLFTGGRSKNGPEYFFRQLAKIHQLKLKTVSNKTPRIHQFLLHDEDHQRVIKTVSLTAPSGAANRAVGSNPLYKKLKAQNPAFTTIDFRIQQYRQFFE